MSVSTKRSSSRSGSRHLSAKIRKKVLAGKKSTRLKTATKRSLAGKAPAHKATKAKPKTRRLTAKKRASVAPAKKGVKKAARAVPARQPQRVKLSQVRKALTAKKTPPPPPPPLTHDEAAALRLFEQAHKEFSRGHFAEARSQFRSLVEKYPNVSEVAARARTYLNVAEARLRSDLALPRDADSLYDRGVIELNRGEYVAAHIHYGLAATRARLGAIDTALVSLRRALDLQPNLRIRAQRDHDLSALHSQPEFEQLVFAGRS